MVTVFANGAKVCGFKPGKRDGFLRAIKIHSKPSSKGKKKPVGPML
jgi:hypothetical protein